MVKHIKCAIKEKPFIKGEKFANNNITQILEYYALNNIVKKETTGDTTTYKWNGTTYPASEISLRNATDATYTIQQREQTEKIGQNIKTKIIGTVDKHYAHTMLYPNAIYTHMGKNYIVTQLDTEHKKCTVTETTTRQYTETISSSSVTITKEIEKSQNIGWGKSIITTTPFMYITKEINTHKKTGQGKIQTPKEETKTTSAWIILPEEIINRRDGIETADAIKSLLQNIIPLYLMCDTKDIEIHEETEKLTNGRFAIYISDTIPGGIGLAEGTYQSCNKILKSCMELLKTCKCQNGCPLCIGAPEADSTPNMKMQTYKTIKQIIEGK